MGINSVRALVFVTGVAVLVAGCSSSKAGTGSAGSSPATSTSATISTTPPAPSTSASQSSAVASTTPVSTTPIPAPDLAAFTGKWIGHDRSVTISASGLGQEFVGDGCCTKVLSLSFKITATSMSGTQEVATVDVTTASAGSEYSGTPPKAGDTGTLSLKGGVLTDSFGSNTFCDAAQEAAGTCGA